MEKEKRFFVTKYGSQTRVVMYYSDVAEAYFIKIFDVLCKDGFSFYVTRITKKGFYYREAFGSEVYVSWTAITETAALE